MESSNVAATSTRLPGLDTLRALAILLVFAYHYQGFVSGEATFGWASELGWTGVDLFFVLSGYLIGHQLLRTAASPSGLSLPRFWARRLMRTVPAFWVVLALYLVFPALMGGREPPPWWRFVSFTQNIQLIPGTAFSHAWSLCIEEQFYLVLPLLVAIGVRQRLPRWLGWALIAAGTVAAMVWRHHLWTRYGSIAGGEIAGYYPNVYYATLCRADEFLPGLAIAMFRHQQPLLWQRALAHGQAWLLAGVVAVGAMFAALNAGYYTDEVGYGMAMTTVGYSLMAWAWAVLLMAALCPGSALHRWRVPGAAPLALWSYSIYLTHKPLAHIANNLLMAQGVDRTSLITVAVASLASLLGGWLLHVLVERQGLALRDRWWPDARPGFAAQGVALPGDKLGSTS